MKNVGTKYIVTALCTVFLCSCSVTRHLAPGDYMLTESKVEVDKSAPRDERITAGDLDKYIRQTPAKKFLGFNIPVWIYNQANPDKNNGWNKLLRRIGSEPVIFDSTQTIRSNKNLKMYMDSRGFYESRSNYSVKYKQRNRKAMVTYSVEQGHPYRIKSLSYDYQDKFLEQVIRQDSAAMLVRPGEIFDIEVLNQERQRIATYLKTQGYYNFSINNINYIADTAAGSYGVDLTMIIKQRAAGYDADGKPIMENNSIYRINDIYVHPNYNPTKAATDPKYLSSMDTTFYKGLRIITAGKQLIRPRTLRRAIPIYPDYTYSSADIRHTSDNLLRLNYFKNASVIFSEPPATEENLVTYVGGGDNTDAVHTAEKDLTCNIYCVPALKQGYTLDFEATTSSAFYALRPAISYLNRNLFRGAELLHIGVSGGYEFNRDRNATKNSYEIGASASITFPRFLAPFPIDRAGKLYRPQTKLEIYTNLQRKSKYGRTITGLNFGYTWDNGRHSSYTFRPIDFNIVKVNYIDNDFLCSIQNTYLRESYKSQLIAAMSGSYLYNNPSLNGGRNSLTVRVNAETAGNLTSLIVNSLTKPVREQINVNDCGGDTPSAPIYETFYKAFNIRYSQYARIDASVASTVPLGEKTAIAYRFFGGIGLPYGNSSSMPMDRMFYVGGSNSMRGWLVRTLGPGNSPDGRDKGFNNQLGNIRLEANFEFRFPIWSSLNGAVFGDVGNIWVTKIPGAASDEIFRFNSFYKQLGFDSGLGLRYDLSIVVIRLDWGIKIHDPSMPAGQRWINSFKWKNTVLNFGIGYPF